MEGIAVGIPAYRHPEAVSWVVGSFLRQTYENITVFVFDDGFPEGFGGVNEALRDIRDRRLIYRSNYRKLGHLENYRRCFATVSSYQYGMVLPADVGLLPRSLEVLTSSLRETGAEIAFGRAMRFKDLHEASAITSASSDSLSGPEIGETESITSLNLVNEFLGDMNLSGEYNRFSVLGALGRGHLFRPLASLSSPYRFHGWEFQNSMIFASQASQINLLRGELRVAVTGLKKYSGAQRPASDWTRVEHILATYETAAHLREKDSYFSSRLNLEKVRGDHLRRLRHYSKVYGQHKVVAWATRIILLSPISRPLALRFFFSLLVRFGLRS